MVPEPIFDPICGDLFRTDFTHGDQFSPNRTIGMPIFCRKPKAARLTIWVGHGNRSLDMAKILVYARVEIAQFQSLPRKQIARFDFRACRPNLRHIFWGSVEWEPVFSIWRGAGGQNGFVISRDMPRKGGAKSERLKI